MHCLRLALVRIAMCTWAALGLSVSLARVPDAPEARMDEHGVLQVAERHRGVLQPAGERRLETRWPILLSHPFGNDATRSFRGDTQDQAGDFRPFGVKDALTAAGAVVYQPDKIAFGSHQNRGELLYRKCAGTTLSELLCQGPDPKVVDGVHHAIVMHCASTELRSRQGFSDEASCRKGLRFNLICHSQGCVDSRYMMVAVRNAFSGLPMYRHIASWTSLAGANKGTAQTDLYLDLTAACVTAWCRAGVFDAFFTLMSWRYDRKEILNGGESMIGLSRRYMLDSMDYRCKPAPGKACAPAFNDVHRFPVDPHHPVLYQSFSITIDDIRHPCNRKHDLIWRYLRLQEGANDGNISLDSQRFTTYGRDGSGGRTPVIARPFPGRSLDPTKPHPGMYHMAFSDYVVAGMGDGAASCAGEDNRHLRFSREAAFKDVVAELAERGY